MIERIERSGLSAQPELIELAAMVAIIDGALESPAGRLRRAVARIVAIQDKSNAAAPFRNDVACRKGCTFCCSLNVSAVAPQIFAVADHIRANVADLPAEIARIDAADAHTRGLDAYGRFVNKAFCAFLIDGACSVYPARPAVCRGALSRSALACESAYRGETADNPAAIDAATVYRTACDEAFLAVLHKRGLRLAAYELAHAVLVALSDAEAETRWRTGEDVFAPVRAETLASNANDDAFWSALWNAAHGDPVASAPYSARFPDWCR
ncbi:MAG: YkgJ family cysteine cluster protein [Gemmatimonas sp.]